MSRDRGDSNPDTAHGGSARQRSMAGGGGGAPTSFGLTVDELKQIMELRGHEGADRVREMGGAEAICDLLSTSPSQGPPPPPYLPLSSFLPYLHSLPSCLSCSFLHLPVCPVHTFPRFDPRRGGMLWQW